ncbi:MAG: nucleoside phosphorylase [Deltaproteobacteria bacterium]|nr:nucleoside phosphorylase [Deltaproteobacteria bacterium]
MAEKKHSDGIIQPRRGKGDPRLAPDVLMVMIPGELQYLAQKSGAIKTVFSNMRIYDLYRTQGEKKASVTLAGPFIGAPLAVMGMEKLVAMGAERFLVLGWCGSIQPFLEIGDLVIPTHAVSEEGTSQHYPTASNNPAADAALIRILETSLEERKTPFTKGPIWTTDAIYRETPEKVKAYQQQNILAVEMEISALLAVSSFRAVPMAALLVVSDELSSLKWRPGFSDGRLKKMSRAAAETLLEVHQYLGQAEIDSEQPSNEPG